MLKLKEFRGINNLVEPENMGDKELAVALDVDVGPSRELLQEAHDRIATASAAAVSEYAATANELLGQCSQRYTELAAKADGHALDARTCRAALPVTTGSW